MKQKQDKLTNKKTEQSREPRTSNLVSRLPLEQTVPVVLLIERLKTTVTFSDFDDIILIDRTNNKTLQIIDFKRFCKDVNLILSENKDILNQYIISLKNSKKVTGWGQSSISERIDFNPIKDKKHGGNRYLSKKQGVEKVWRIIIKPNSNSMEAEFEININLEEFLGIIHFTLTKKNLSMANGEIKDDRWDFVKSYQPPIIPKRITSRFQDEQLIA